MPLGIQLGDSGEAFDTAVTTAGITTTTGSTFVVIVVHATSAGVTGVTDSFGNTYTQLGTGYAQNGPARISAWQCQNGTGGAAHTATATAAAANWCRAFLVEISGAAAASLDQWVDFTNDTASPYTSGTTGTTTQANQLVLAALLSDNYGTAVTWTWGNSFTQLAAVFKNTYGDLAIGYRIVSSTGAYQSSVTGSASPSNVATLIATFKEAAGGGGTIARLAAALYAMLRGR